MKQKKQLVSIVIPGRNSGKFLSECLTSIQRQTYKSIETIVVDSYSKDSTSNICHKFNVKLIQFDNSTLRNVFDATHKRNLGIQKSKGDYVYYVDADFRLSPNLIKCAVEACNKENCDAIIIREKIYGSGFWTRCKALEQDLIANDDNVEAPRFFKRKIWEELGGLDASLGAGCDDWDLYQRFIQKGYKVKRIGPTLKHFEGRITLIGAFKKAVFYGQDVHKFVRKSPDKSVVFFFPVRTGYLRNWEKAVAHPVLTLGIVVIRLVEYSGGLVGILKNAFFKNND